MAPKSPISQADIKAFLAQQVRDDVKQLRRELALGRVNINKAIGVGNMNDYIREWEVDFANSTIGAKTPEVKSKSLKKVTATKKRTKL